MPGQNVVLRVSGLHTNPNYLSSVPEGSLSVLSNFNHDRDGVIEKRRGFAVYSNEFAERIDQLIVYKDTLIAHSDDKLFFDSNPFTQYIGTFTSPGAYRLKYQEANRNLYITTNVGIMKLDAKSSLDVGQRVFKPAGAVRAGAIEGVTTGTTGFLPPLSKVAYRIVWGYTDNNNNRILGYPSEVEIVTNTSLTDNSNVDLSFFVPQGTDRDYFYQIYRSPFVTAPSAPDLDTVIPEDELNLVIEEFPSEAQFSSGTITVVDVTPEDFRNAGTILYTNPISGGGILSANEIPPLAQDIALYQNFMFFGNTKTRHKLSINLLSIDDLYDGQSKLIISDGTIREEYTFDTTEILTGFQIRRFTAGSVGQNVQNTGRSIARVVSASSVAFRCYYVSAINDVPGQLVFDRADLTDLPFSIAIEQGDPEEFNQVPSQSVQYTLSGLTVTNRTLSFDSTADVDVVTDTITIPNHQYYTGQEIKLGGVLPAGLTAGLYYVFKLTDNTFQLCLTKSDTKKDPPPVVDITATAVGTSTVQETHDLITGDIVEFSDVERRTVTVIDNTSFTILTAVSASGNYIRTDVASENEAFPNRLYYSKLQQPEAVPILNFIDIGPADKEILRIVALRDNLYIFKQDGIYRLSGGSPESFFVTLFDNSAIITAPDSCSVLNNKIYLLSTQGIISVSDSGVEIVSKPIENIINKVSNNSIHKTETFGFSSESDRSYHMFTTLEQTDTTPTICFRYNSDTMSWSTWDMSKTAGVVNPGDNKIYLSASDNFIEQERKNLNRTDFADREFPAQLGAFGINENILTSLNPFNSFSVGDVIFQRQYLTINDLKIFLRKLDNDIQYKFDIVDITEGAITVIEAPGHNLATGDVVIIKDVTGSAASLLNAEHTVTVIDSDFFSVPINTAIYTAIGGRYKYASFANVQPEAGDNLFNKTRDIALRLQTDLDTGVLIGGFDSFYGTTSASVWNINDEPLTFEELQQTFNQLVNRCNNISTLYLSNYKESTGTKDYEEVVTAINRVQKRITVSTKPSFIEGPLTLFKGIPSRFVYNPTPMGDPSLLKRVIDAGIVLEENNFTSCIVEFATDLSRGFEGVEYKAEGVGLFGNLGFGDDGFGGGSTAQPARTLVPREKSRCRYISPAMRHGNAREEVKVFGFNLTVEITSQRAYRGKK